MEIDMVAYRDCSIEAVGKDTEVYIFTYYEIAGVGKEGIVVLNELYSLEIGLHMTRLGVVYSSQDTWFVRITYWSLC